MKYETFQFLALVKNFSNQCGNPSRWISNSWFVTQLPNYPKGSRWLTAKNKNKELVKNIQTQHKSTESLIAKCANTRIRNMLVRSNGNLNSRYIHNVNYLTEIDRVFDQDPKRLQPIIHDMRVINVQLFCYLSVKTD